MTTEAGKTAITLIRMRAEPDVATYAAVHSGDASRIVNGWAGQPGAAAEALPWDALPGVQFLAAAELRHRPPGTIALLGTAVGREWTTWRLPVEPPPVPAQAGEDNARISGRERVRRAGTIAYLGDRGAVEGRDWRWGTVAEWDLPAVADAGRTIEVQERLTPEDGTALPIMIASSGVRLLGAPLLAAAMDSGQFPAEMPFAVVAPARRPAGRKGAMR
jgi:hypothetical protein